MSPLFGKKKSHNSTIAIIDIESGSVGSALVYLARGQRPKLLAQMRRPLTARISPSAGNLMKEIERELHESLVHLSTVAARMRLQTPDGEGNIGRIAVFLHAPWVSTEHKAGKMVANTHDAVLESLRGHTVNFFDSIPVSFHAFSTTATPVIHGIFEQPEHSLVCSIGGEIAELSLLRGGIVAGHATIPTGFNTVLRTLEAHAGISRAEAYSALSLAATSREHEWAEALTASISHLTAHLGDALSALVPKPGEAEAQRVFVIAPQGTGELFARTFTEDTRLHNLFAPESTIRAISPRHLTPHMGAHPQAPDLALLLESLFVDTRFATAR